MVGTASAGSIDVSGDSLFTVAQNLAIQPSDAVEHEVFDLHDICVFIEWSSSAERNAFTLNLH